MHVPEYPEKQWPVTLRQVMGHLAGVRSDSGDEGPFRGRIAQLRHGRCPRVTDYSCYGGGAAFVSTPSDLVRFGIGVQRGKLLKPATVEGLQASQQLRSGQETGYGLGWDRETVTLAGEETTLVGHDGLWMGGPVAAER